MIPLLIDGAILAILIAVGIRLDMTARELRRLRDYHAHYREVLDETADAAAEVGDTVREIHDRGAQILLTLGARIGDGYKLAGELDTRLNALAQQLEPESVAIGNVVHFSPPAVASARRAPRIVKRAAAG